MEKLIPVFFVFLIACSEDSRRQSFDEYGFSIICPCKLIRDTIAEIELNKKTGFNTHYLFCLDSNSMDKYSMNIVLRNSTQVYTPKEIIDAFDSTLIARGIKYEKREFENEAAIVIDYGRAIELTILTNDQSYYFIVEAEDSIQSKFDRTISTLKLR